MKKAVCLVVGVLEGFPFICFCLRLQVPAGHQTLDSRTSKVPRSHAGIPHKLLFNFKTNLLAQHNSFPETTANVKNTIAHYPGFDVLFFDDAKCMKAIEVAHSKELANHFARESSHAYKLDVCRMAMLHQYGGYYFDNDIDMVGDVRSSIPGDATFVTALAAWQPNGHNTEVWNAFLAARPGHPVIVDALRRTMERYRSGRVGRFPNHPVMKGHLGSMRADEVDANPNETVPVRQNLTASDPNSTLLTHEDRVSFLGTEVIAEALRSWLKVGELRQGPNINHEKGAVAYLLQEDGEMDPRNSGKVDRYGLHGHECCGDWCRMFVRDSNRGLFWSRYVDSTRKCR
eukprot:gnl/TRDRNA2_/TRDRNA2_175358_c6_seq9.p1 gnl/TRDRNA2_/TRDRNA2_175358_c6~~gnl/TRDRNA2_/TRDRNA2_175358_c6_seq9.p1  ORF type:complete len:344 (-),score=27.20 gnl/TRDRNA2_/TRDRNA2_175358_c6_seq9:101-1132(-)